LHELAVKQWQKLSGFKKHYPW